MALDPNTEAGQRIQEKSDAYMIGLIFTILGLSIQTAKFDGPPVVTFVELGAWLLLLTSGLAGLSRLDWLPQQYRLFGLKSVEERLRREAFTAYSNGQRVGLEPRSGKPMPIEQFIQERAAALELIDEKLKPIDQKTMSRYKLMKGTFLGGVITLVAARALVPLEAAVVALTR